jgi:hypothetical protein
MNLDIRNFLSSVIVYLLCMYLHIFITSKVRSISLCAIAVILLLLEVVFSYIFTEMPYVFT